MEFKITEKHEQALVGRTEVVGTVAFKGEVTPSNATLKQKIADAMNADSQNVVMKGISTQFGSSEATFRGHVYADAKLRKTFVPMTKKMKDDEKKRLEEQRAAGAKAEEAKAAEQQAAAKVE